MTKVLPMVGRWDSSGLSWWAGRSVTLSRRIELIRLAASSCITLFPAFCIAGSMQSSVVCSQDSFRQIDETIVGSADRLGLAISTNFSGEQREKALRIWSPILKRLQPILAHLNRLEIQGTPNGLIATGYAGWSLALCCNEDESMPHYIGIRDRYSEDAGALRAFLTGNGYVVETDDGTDPVLDSVLRAVVEGLGGTRLEPSSPEPHREPAKRPSPRSRKTTVAKIAKVRHL